MCSLLTRADRPDSRHDKQGQNCDIRRARWTTLRSYRNVWAPVFFVSKCFMFYSQLFMFYVVMRYATLSSKSIHTHVCMYAPTLPTYIQLFKPTYLLHIYTHIYYIYTYIFTTYIPTYLLHIPTYLLHIYLHIYNCCTLRY